MSQPQVGSAAAAASSAGRDSVLVLEPRRGWQLVDFADLWRYRELLWILALRDIKVRYKQTQLGAAWAIIQPLTKMVIFATLFKLMGRAPVESGPIPYAVTAYCALLPWQLFLTSVGQASESLVGNRDLVTKVYFPRIIVPTAPILAALLDFAFAFLVLIMMMVYHGITPGWNVLWLPLFLVLTVVAAFALGLWLSALNALYRDFRYAVPLVLQIGFYISPVIFETDAIIPEKWRFLFSMNPLVGVLDGFRWALLGRPPPAAGPMLASIVVVIVILLSGLVYFRRMERVFADKI